MKRFGLIALCLSVFLSQAALAEITSLPLAVDLRAEAELAGQNGLPLLVVFSRSDCKYCETVKRDYLKPLLADPRYRDRLVVRQIDQGGAQELLNFHGEKSTHGKLAREEKIKLVPVVAFYGPNGAKLAPPIVGARLPDFYQGYLEEAIEQSIALLKNR
jgi:thioredoxin-related protein